MDTAMLYPIKMLPVFKDYLWGGENLAERYGKQTPLRPIAESWEISCYPGSSSVAANGCYKGKTLLEILESHPEMMGNHKEFPILIKFIDARDSLSLQVHPDDSYARRVEGKNGKSEMWYIVDAEPGAEIVAGLKEPISKGELERAIREGTILDFVRRIKVRPGDCYMIPAGLLHAIGGGLLIAEVQQSSDVTYRVHDYGRAGADGKARELHVDKAADVIDASLVAGDVSEGASEIFDGYTETILASWKYFGSSLLRVDGNAMFADAGDGFRCLLVTKGELALKCGATELGLNAGDSVFIPAGLGKYTLSGHAEVLTASC